MTSEPKQSNDLSQALGDLSQALGDVATVLFDTYIEAIDRIFEHLTDVMAPAWVALAEYMAEITAKFGQLQMTDEQIAIEVYGMTESDIDRIEGGVIWSKSRRWVHIETGRRGWLRLDADLVK